MLKYQDKVKLAINSMDTLIKILGTTGADRKIKVLADNWISHTRKPFTQEDYDRMLDKLTAHLRKKPLPNIPDELI